MVPVPIVVVVVVVSDTCPQTKGATAHMAILNSTFFILISFLLLFLGTKRSFATFATTGNARLPIYLNSNQPGRVAVQFLEYV